MRQLFAALLLTVFSLLAHAQNRGLPDFTELVEKHGAAVVNVSTMQTARGGGRGATALYITPGGFTGGPGTIQRQDGTVQRDNHAEESAEHAEQHEQADEVRRDARARQRDAFAFDAQAD